MKKDIREYFTALKGIFEKIEATAIEGEVYQLEGAIEKAMSIIMEQAALGWKLLFIGNGASASIASHMAADFCKNGGIRALAFNDSALLTSISNDYGYAHVFEKPIEMFANEGDVLVAISSSGRSENIIRAVSMARLKGCRIITLSGFSGDNPLRPLGDLNFYVPYSAYGPVEVAHHAICHCILDTVVRGKNKSKIAEQRVITEDRV